jgi:hypothetical protein
MLEHDAVGSKKKSLDSFAARVLASLLQAQPNLTFRVGTAGNDLLSNGRIVYGRVMLCACERLLVKGGFETGCKLLPLTIQQILKLSRPSETSAESVVADSLMAQLTQIFRIQLASLVSIDPQLHEQTSGNCLSVMLTVLQPSFEQTWSVSLRTLAMLLQQMNHRDQSVRACVQSMLDLQCTLAEDEHLQDAINDACSSLIQALGIERFWDQIEMKSLCLSDDDAPSKLGKFPSLDFAGCM